MWHRSGGHIEHSQAFPLRRYENKYVKFFRSKPELPPGLSPEAAAAPGKAEASDTGLSKAAKRNLKRKEKRKQQQEKGERDTDKLIQALERSALSDPLPSCGTASPGVSPGTSPGDAPASERSRRLKNLRKKLRQVEELQHRLDAGEVPNPTREQLEKLSRRKTLEEELRGLERDS